MRTDEASFIDALMKKLKRGDISVLTMNMSSPACLSPTPGWSGEIDAFEAPQLRRKLNQILVRHM
jgi:hypothetical protein